MKKLFSILAAVMLVFCAAPVMAAGVLLNDNAGVLSSEEVSELEARLSEIGDEYNFDPVIVFTQTAGPDIVSYSDDYFDYNGYGRGVNKTGVLMMIDIINDERYISTSGDCIGAYTDEVISYIGKDLAASVDSRDYYEACEKFAGYAEEIMRDYRSGFEYKTPFRPSGTGTLVVLAISAVAAFIAGTAAKKSTQEAVTPVDADIYAKGGSAQITMSRDLFLYSHISRTERSDDSNRSGGGSSTHTSSSGHTHGGGRFK